MGKLVLALALVAIVALSAEANKVKISKLRERYLAKSVKHGKVLDLIQDAVTPGKKASKQDPEGNSFSKRNDRQKKYVRVIHLQQEFQGLQVFGYGATVQEVPEQTISKHVQATTIINGEFVGNLKGVAKKGDYERLQRRKGKIFLKIQADHQKKNHAGQKNDFDIGLPDDIEPIIYVEPDTNEAVKGYLVRFVDRTSAKPSYPNYVVDENGKVLDQWEGLNTQQQGAGPGGNEKIGRTDYTDIPITDLGNGRCQFDTPEVRTIDLENSRNNRKTTPFQFDCYENTNREVNGAFAPMNDAQFYGTKVFQMFLERYNTSPLESTPLLLKVHYSRNYDNAFFDGNSMTFGDGARIFYPLTSLDVVAHEVCHGVTDQSSQLIYRDQSGGLNEAFSDMSGKAVERFVRGPENANYLLGFDIFKSADGALRYMDNPPRDGRSIDHVRDYRRGFVVHYSSGIFNKAFALMSSNPNFVNDLQDAYDLFYVANTQYWGRSTGFTQGAELMLQATLDIKAGMHLPGDYSHISLDVITDSFRTVGVDCNLVGEAYDCTELP